LLCRCRAVAGVVAFLACHPRRESAVAVVLIATTPSRRHSERSEESLYLLLLLFLLLLLPVPPPLSEPKERDPIFKKPESFKIKILKIPSKTTCQAQKPLKPNKPNQIQFAWEFLSIPYN
jgi:hypothetical protein